MIFFKYTKYLTGAWITILGVDFVKWGRCYMLRCANMGISVEDNSQWLFSMKRRGFVYRLRFRFMVFNNRNKKPINLYRS